MNQEIHPVVSFVVPVYNVKTYLETCINSMLQQTESDYEIILIDDGSTDGSGEICRQYAEQNDKIILCQQKNQGVSIARNQGLKKANGEWICFVDGDDWVEPELVSAMKQVKNHEYDVVFFGYHNVNHEKKETRINTELKHDELVEEDFRKLQMGILNQGDVRLKEYRYIEGTPWAKLYRKSFLEENQLQFTPGVRKGQDGLFNMQVYKVAQSGLYVNQAIYNYRINEGSVCRRYNSKIAQYSQHLISEYRKLLEQWEQQELNEMFDYFVVRQFMYDILLDFCHKDNSEHFQVRKERYQQEKKVYQAYIHQLKLGKMKKNEKALLILIRFAPFFCMDWIVKSLK